MKSINRPQMPPANEDHHARARGKCSLCGEPLNSATSLYCVSCYRKCLKPCVECTGPGLKGRRIILRKYQRHQGMPCDVKMPNGSLMPRICDRCGVGHTEDVQLICSVCKNERVVFELPKEKSDGD